MRQPFFVACLALCSFACLDAAAQRLSVQAASVSDDWKLTAKQAARMMKYYKDCEEGCQTATATPDSAMEAAVKVLYPNAKSFDWMDARYRDEDVARYASRNARVLKSGGEQVAGYTTKILKVVDADERVYFFDIARICPAPADCADASAARTNDN